MDIKDIIQIATEQNVRAMERLRRFRTGNLTKEDLQYEIEHERMTQNHIKQGFFCPDEGFQPNYCNNIICQYKNICKAYNRKT